jgi:carbamoyl-phosphate synthase large subunit
MYDKMACNRILMGSGLVPRTISVESGNSLGDVGAELGYPYWVRKAEGAGAIGALKITREEDLMNWLQMNPGMDGMIASEFLPGRNYACKVLYINGKLMRAACAERVAYLLAKAAPSGVSGMCARGRLINDAGLIALSDKAVCEVFSHHAAIPHGMFTVDFKEDIEGKPKLTEINIRHVSFTHAFSLGGANFAHDIFQYLTHGVLSPSEYVQYQFDSDLHFIRGVDSEIFVVSERDLIRKA